MDIPNKSIGPQSQGETESRVVDSPTTPRHGAGIDCGTCDACKKAKHDLLIYRIKIIAGLLMPFTLTTLDLTVVATALSYIAGHFG